LLLSWDMRSSAFENQMNGSERESARRAYAPSIRGMLAPLEAQCKAQHAAGHRICALQVEIWFTLAL